MKILFTGAAAVVAVGAAVVGAVPEGPATHRVAPVVVGVPMPLDPPPAPPAPPEAAPPTPEELTGLLTDLADAGESYKDKDTLVEGGIESHAGHGLDHELRKAYRHGDLPLRFEVTNIEPAGPNQATADVDISGPHMPAPVTKTMTFVNQGGGWVLSKESAAALVQAAMGG